jgi:deoxyribodipyrimidine photo-lyase
VTLGVGPTQRQDRPMLVQRVPMTRVRVRHDLPPAPGRYVLYWMTAARRPRFNFALERAAEWARALRLPLVVLEPLRIAYPHASERFHAFVVDGMRANAATLAARGVLHLPYLEPRDGAGKGLLAALAADAAVVIGDETATFFLPRMIDAASAGVKVRFETVDGAGLLPLSLATTPFGRAYDFRRFLQKTLAPHLRQTPLPDPLEGLTTADAGLVPRAADERWGLLAQRAALDEQVPWSELPLDRRVGRVADRGGHVEGSARVAAFVKHRLSRYGEERSHPDDDAASGLSFWLHWGHTSAHEVLAAIAEATEWTPDRIGSSKGGKKEGWWNASESADSFLDELVTWRELGQVRCRTTDDFDRYEGLPAWARRTLEAHANDPRPHLYTEAQLEAGETEDAIWNAAMRELRETGRIQNYLRMLWGKRVLTWTRHPREAFDVLIRLNDRWSVDGRDPASYSNIGWVLGAYDRPWAPERPIFGSIRMMSSASTWRKLRMRAYFARWRTPHGALPGARDTEQTDLSLD